MLWNCYAKPAATNELQIIRSKSNPKTTSMSKIKTVVDFSSYTGPALSPVAKTIGT